MPKRAFLSAFIICGTFFCSEAVFAQSATIEQKQSARTTTKSVTPTREGILMRNGRMMVILANGYAPLTAVRTFPNGAKIAPSGLLTTPEGEKITLQEGDRLDLQGTLTRSPVITQQSTTTQGDTTGFGKQLLYAKQLQERITLLQRKMSILEKKNEILDSTAKDKSKAAGLKKLNADLAKVQKQLEAAEK